MILGSHLVSFSWLSLVLLLVSLRLQKQLLLWLASFFLHVKWVTAFIYGLWVCCQVWYSFLCPKATPCLAVLFLHFCLLLVMYISVQMLFSLFFIFFYFFTFLVKTHFTLSFTLVTLDHETSHKCQFCVSIGQYLATVWNVGIWAFWENHL